MLAIMLVTTSYWRFNVGWNGFLVQFISRCDVGDKTNFAQILQLSTTTLVQHFAAILCSTVSDFICACIWLHLIASDCILKQNLISRLSLLHSTFVWALFDLIKIKYLILLVSPFVTFAVLLSTRSIIFKQAFHWSMQFKVFLRTLRL